MFNKRVHLLVKRILRFSWNLIFECFSKIFPENLSFIKKLTIMSPLHEDKCTFLILSCSFLVRMKNISGKNFRENQNTRFMFSNFFFFSENPAVYQLMWKNTAESGRPQMAIWRTRIARWIAKATNTLRICSTYCFSTATKVCTNECLWYVVIRTYFSLFIASTQLWGPPILLLG